MCNTGSSTQCSVMTQRGGIAGVGGRPRRMPLSILAGIRFESKGDFEPKPPPPQPLLFALFVPKLSPASRLQGHFSVSVIGSAPVGTCG